MGYLLRAPQAAVKGTAGLHSHLKAQWGRVCLQAFSGCCHSPFSFSSRTQGPSFLLVIGWKLPSVPRGCLKFLPCGHPLNSSQYGSLHLQSSQSQQASLSVVSCTHLLVILQGPTQVSSLQKAFPDASHQNSCSL